MKSGGCAIPAETCFVRKESRRHQQGGGVHRCKMSQLTKKKSHQLYTVPTHTPTHTHAPTHTPTHAPTHTRTNTLTRTNTRTNTHANTHTNTLTRTNTHTHTNTRTNTLTRTNTHTNTLTRTNTLTHTNTLTRTNTHTHQHQHTHQHTHETCIVAQNRPLVAPVSRQTQLPPTRCDHTSTSVHYRTLPQSNLCNSITFDIVTNIVLLPLCRYV